ncbi:MAG TPA: hypothetical protein VFX76_14620 [Roseiflexaceae bacterium]|nr:hypothetical protein [Roseiflexaceae bacterium]
MSEPTEARPTTPLPPPAAPAPSRGGCVGRFVSALLVILITTFLAVVSVVLLYLFVLETPNQIADLRGRAATAEAQNAALRAQNDTMQTQVAEVASLSGANREALGELQQQKAALDDLRADLTEAANQNATVVAEARTSRDAVALFATAEAGRAALLDTLQRRSERIERFLERLSDISDDAALDLNSGASPLPTTPTGDTTTSPSPTPTAEPSPSAEPSATPVAEPTTTRRPSATAEASSTEAPAASPSTTATP